MRIFRRLSLKDLLPDKVAIINGGTTGMGRSTALLFAEEGCSCVIAGRDETNGQQTAAEATRRGKKSIFVPCDITDLQQIKYCVDQTVKTFGKVDILVGCAGSSFPRGKMKAAPQPVVRPPRGIQYTDETFYDVMMALNLKGHVFFCKEVAPLMIQQKSGKIVLISSMGVFNPPAASIEYHTAKAGILGLTYNLAFELAPHNINVNAILPGPILTPFWDPVLAAMPETERKAYLEQMGKNTPLGRAGQPEDIANAVLFLSSEMSSYITGQTLNVSGGMPLGRYRAGGFTALK
jgi:NAD(P)-dependent dehydrogenase (short-subunit alcohol dehydrogenase family)